MLLVSFSTGKGEGDVMAMLMCLEAIPERRSEVISGKYIVQYLCSAGSSAAVVPLVKVIGVGWTFTICE